MRQQCPPVAAKRPSLHLVREPMASGPESRRPDRRRALAICALICLLAVGVTPLELCFPAHADLIRWTVCAVVLALAIVLGEPWRTR